jgi:hypothetical protein
MHRNETGVVDITIRALVTLLNEHSNMRTHIYYHETDLFPYQPVSHVWTIIYIVLSFGFFNILNRMTDEKHNWLKQNTLISFIHSSITSVLVIISVVRAPEIFKDPLSHSNDFNYAVLAFTAGYFLYDFVDCLLNATSNFYPILFHHIVVLAFLVYVLYYTRNIGYSIYGLSIEMNSMFLHGRRLLRWYKSIYYYNLVKIVADIGNYITFIILRFGIIFVVLRAAYSQQDRLHPIVYYFSVLCVLAIGVLNVVLLYRLIKNDLRKKSKLKPDKKMEDQILMTDNHVLLPS